MVRFISSTGLLGFLERSCEDQCGWLGGPCARVQGCFRPKATLPVVQDRAAWKKKRMCFVLKTRVISNVQGRVGRVIRRARSFPSVPMRRDQWERFEGNVMGLSMSH